LYCIERAFILVNDDTGELAERKKLGNAFLSFTPNPKECPQGSTLTLLWSSTAEQYLEQNSIC